MKLTTFRRYMFITRVATFGLLGFAMAKHGMPPLYAAILSVTFYLRSELEFRSWAFVD